MSLTMGTGPFGHAPAGRFNVDVPAENVLYTERSPRWVRARRAGRIVLDSRRAMVLHQSQRLARYFVPREDVDWEALGDVEPIDPPAGAPGLDGHVGFAFDAMDAWLEEEDEIVSHAPDPYHRIDVRRTSRHVRIAREGTLLAETRRAHVLFETSLPPRWYLPREDVVAGMVRSDLRSTCAYKGHADYWTIGGFENIAWSYADPLHDALKVRDLVAFFDEQVDLDVDGERMQRPGTPWAAPRWWEVPEPR
jgi:uncharacterized protein (DUF427 family)